MNLNFFLLAKFFLASQAIEAPNQRDIRAGSRDNGGGAKTGVSSVEKLNGFLHNDIFEVKAVKGNAPPELGTDGKPVVTLKDVMFVPGEPEIPDIDYFRFDEENLNKSGQAAFYALWTMKAQNNTEWNEIGEWGLFAKQFTQTYNFRCSFWAGTCHDKIELGSIKRLYPDPEYRHLVRLIYFTLYKYALLHDYTKATEKMLHDIYEKVVALSPDLIADFTKQVDAKKVQICEIIHDTIEAAIGVVTSVASVFIGGIPVPGIKMWEIPIAGFFKGDEQVKYEYTFNWLQTLAPMVPGWLQTGYGKHKSAWKNEILQLDQGFGQGLLCGAFEGDDTDRSATNLRKLRLFTQKQFEKMEEDTRNTFQSIYEGVILEAGEPSIMALMMTNRKWTGPGSIQADMRNMEPIQEKMTRIIFMDLISSTIRKDGGYIKCTHRIDAADHCAKAAHATNGWRLGLFCPRPDTDPDLICQAARIYQHLYHTHEIPLPGLTSFENYEDKGLPMSRVSMLIEAYDNYIKRGNDLSTDWDQLSMNNATKSGTFRMAVCQNDILEIKDINRDLAPHEDHTQRWAMPAFCGDWRGDETRSFMDAIEIGINSTAWKTYHYGDMQKLAPQLYRDRFPRNIKDLQPYQHYMAMGWIGMQFPDETQRGFPRNWPHNFHRVFMGVDKDFEKIKSATKKMGPFESNYWFCARKPNHSVFQRERAWMQTTDAPVNTYPSHKRMCEDWRKKNAIEITMWNKGERW